MRGPRDEEGNVTYPGKWIKIPKIAKTINCNKYREAAIIDKGIQLRAKQTAPLVNKHYENEVTLR